MFDQPEPTPPTPLFKPDDGNTFHSAYEGKGGTKADSQANYASKAHALDFALFHFDERSGDAEEEAAEIHRVHEDLADARAACQEFFLFPFNSSQTESEKID